MLYEVITSLFKFFWKELELIGARVYEPADYEQAIKLIVNSDLPFETIITATEPLTNIQGLFEQIDSNPEGMKYLLNCQE